MKRAVLAGDLPLDWSRPSRQNGGVSTIEYRSAERSEIPALLEFWAEAAENDSRPSDSVGAVEALLARDADAVIVASVDGRIVGTIIAGFDGWRYHLYRLAVGPSMRRRGIGSALLDRAESRLRALGATRIDAMVLDANARGQAIWRARGYTPQSEWSRWVRNGNP